MLRSQNRVVNKVAVAGGTANPLARSPLGVTAQLLSKEITSGRVPDAYLRKMLMPKWLKIGDATATLFKEIRI